MSELFTRRQLRGLERIGDIMLPATADQLSFSQLGCSRNADTVVRYLPEGDRKDLLMVLGVLAFIPRFMVRMLLWMLDHSERIPGSLGGLLRMARLGLKGGVMTLYYTDERIQARLGYEIGVYTADLSRQQNEAPSPR